MNERPAKWHQNTSEDVCRTLHSNAARGLSRRAARSRFGRSGPNTLFTLQKRSVWAFLRPVLIDPTYLLALFFAVLSLFFGNIAQGLLALGLQFVFTVFLLFYFRRIAVAEQKIAHSRIPRVHVLRDGCVLRVLARRIVPGDILLLYEGDIVPCDCRILSAKDLRVLTLMPGDDGSVQYRELPKNGDTVYPYGSDVCAPYCENMLYGGSEMMEGSARAIATETGIYSFLGAMTAFSLPREQAARRKEREAIHQISPYLRLWGTICILLLPILTVMGLFTLPEHYEIATLFLPLCTLTAIFSPTITGILFGMLENLLPHSCIEKRPYSNQSVIKNACAAKELCRMSDLIVIGNAALSDGILHFDSAITGNGSIIEENDIGNSLLEPISEAICLLSHAGSLVHIGEIQERRDDSQLIAELCTASGMDLDALGVRLLHAEEMAAPNGCRAIAVTLRDRSFELLFSKSAKLPKSCILYENGDAVCVISPEIRQKMQDFCERCVQNGAEPVTIFRRGTSEQFALVGILSVKEGFAEHLDQRLRDLESFGVRTSIFLKGEGESAYRYANAAGLSAFVSVAASDGECISAVQKDHSSVYIGYAKEQLLPWIADLQKSGHRVAIFGGESADRDILCRVPLLISHDSAAFHQIFTEEQIKDHIFADGKPDSACCAESMRRRADVLVHRASRYEGGIISVFELLKSVRANRYRMQNLLSCLVPLQLSAVLFLLLLTAFGIGLPSAGMLWICCVAVELFIVLRLSNAKMKDVHLQTYRPLSGSMIAGILLGKTNLILCTSAFLIALIIGILRWCGVIGYEIVMFAIPVILIFLSLTAYWSLFLQKKIVCAKRDILLPFLLFLLPFALFLFLCTFFPSFSAVSGAWCM